ncbi:MAG: UDP-N-acetylmuramoyl-L-alanine--D-glutamate ligase [Planctomycetes bacterium]|nr:UDP-N-acetylmuramoyl-L-alanine--D-glutamate ligase [Planctomycetota bacterium]
MTKRALVMGLGLFGGGVAVTRYLLAQDYSVLVTDLRDAATLDKSIKELAGLDVEFRLGEHRHSDFESADLVIKSPAVRSDNEYIEAARRAGARVSSEIVLFAKACPAPIVGVTGSNGKTTTSHMVHAVLSDAWQRRGAKAWLGGNLGRSLLLDLEDIKAEDIVVLELSSFQLMDLAAAHFHPSHALITNITPNHLDWHKDMAEYVRAKASIFVGASEKSTVVLNAEDEICRRLAGQAAGQVRWFGTGFRGQGVELRDEGLVDPSNQATILPANELSLPGRHNLMNAAAAAALGMALGIEPAQIAASLKSLKGVEHRLEFVREVKGVRYFNDSIATTPESTIAALRSFACPITVLLGGSDKGTSFDELAQEIALTPALRKVYLNGPVAGRINEAIHAACRAKPDPTRALVVEEVKSFDEAVLRNHRTPVPGSVFLMSPACASFYEFREGEKFRNFEHRGEHFKSLVKGLE